MKSPIFKIGLLFIIVGLLVIGIKAKVSRSFFSDTETQTNNTISTATSFGPNPGDVVINEIMWMGSQGNSADEWIELRNMTNRTIDLSNWVVVNLGEGGGPNANITIPSGKSIGPYGFFLISNDPKGTSIINIDPDFQTSSVSLQNNGEQLILKNSSGTVMDTANGSTGDWLAGEDPAGQNPKKSMERNSIPGNGIVAGSWHTASMQVNLDLTAAELATPRAANSSP